jgi:8-amino-7-oxononanoate synthase
MSGPATSWAEADLARLSQLGLQRSLEPIEHRQGARIRVGGEWLVNFSSNDYLGLAGDPRLAAAAKQALDANGTGTGASRLITGDTPVHQALEARLAHFARAPAAVLFNSGYAANTGILQTLCGPGDAVFSDALNHASLIDGCRLSRAAVEVYPHSDTAALDRILAASSARRKVVCTDAVFSMDGDRAPLNRLVEICDRHRAALVVDEAHAVGVVGPGGRGLSVELGLADRVDVRMGTLGKAFGAFGAFAATSRAVAELLVNRARPLVFSTSLPAAVCGAALEAIGIAESDDLRRATLWRNVERLATGLRSLGVAAEPRSPIFSIVLGAPEDALEAARRLRGHGLLVKAIRPPTVPEGTSRLRISLSAAHALADVDLLVDGLSQLPELRRAA